MLHELILYNVTFLVENLFNGPKYNTQENTVIQITIKRKNIESCDTKTFSQF